MESIVVVGETESKIGKKKDRLRSMHLFVIKRG